MANPMFPLLYRFHMCQHCGIGPPMDETPLRVCSGCRVSNFCSRECQKSAWPVHRIHCARFAQARHLMASTQPVEDRLLSREWQRRARAVFDATRDRDVRSVMACTPRCNGCLVAGEGVALTPCSHCYSAWSCADCDMPPHHCGPIALGRLLRYFITKHDMKPILELGATPSAVWSGSWGDYWAAHPLPVAITDATMKIVAKGITEHSLSWVGTLLHALSRLPRPVVLPERSAVVVHVIGADMCDLFVTPGGEELLHSLPNAASLHCIYVGPDLPNFPHVTTTELKCCPDCTGMGRTRTMSIHRGLWHDVRAQLPPPTFVLALNSGCHDHILYPDWTPTLNALKATPTVGVFTAYTSEELVMDVAAVAGHGNSVVWSGENPFPSPMALDDPSDVGEAFCDNGFALAFDNRPE